MQYNPAESVTVDPWKWQTTTETVETPTLETIKTAVEYMKVEYNLTPDNPGFATLFSYVLDAIVAEEYQMAAHKTEAK